MRTKVGLWIDHRKAIVVAVTDKGEEIALMISKVEKQLRRSGDSPLNTTTAIEIRIRGGAHSHSPKHSR